MPGIGETLREARTAAGIQLDDAERTIRIRIRYLDALENVLSPYPLLENRELLLRTGFTAVDVTVCGDLVIAPALQLIGPRLRAAPAAPAAPAGQRTAARLLLELKSRLDLDLPSDVSFSVVGSVGGASKTLQSYRSGRGRAAWSSGIGRAGLK